MCGLESKALRKPRGCGNLGHVRTRGLVLSPGPCGHAPHRPPAPPCSSSRLPRSLLRVTEDKGTCSRGCAQAPGGPWRPLEAGPASLLVLLSSSSRRCGSCAIDHMRLKLDTRDACETTKIKTAEMPVSSEVRSSPCPGVPAGGPTRMAGRGVPYPRLPSLGLSAPGSACTQPPCLPCPCAPGLPC